MDWECLLCFASRCGQDVIAHTHSSCWLFAFLSHHPATFFLFHFFCFLSTWSRRSRRLVENNFLLLCVHEPCQYNFIMRTQIKPTTTSVATKNQTKCTTKAMDKTYDETEQRILLTVHREGRKWCEWERNEIVNYFEKRESKFYLLCASTWKHTSWSFTIGVEHFQAMPIIKINIVRAWNRRTYFRITSKCILLFGKWNFLFFC